MSDYTPRPASDYAPSTEEVRRVVMSLNNYLDEPRAAELDGELFDLWLAEVKAQEAKAERQRIKQRLWDDGYLYEMERDHVWALIEGETEQVPYTPTTEDARRVARILSTCREFDPEMCDGCDKRVQEAERLLNSRWLAEVKREAKADGFDEGWDARVNAETITPTENPYRQGENSE